MNLVKLESYLLENFPELTCCLFESLPSTSDYLKSFYKKSPGKKAFCLTASQTAGYGQRGRRWVAVDSAWTFSLLLPISRPIQNCGGLSSVIGLSLIQTLQKFNQNPLQIKWPNDIWDDSGKLGGILIESVKLKSDKTWFVIGIGLNVSIKDPQILPAGSNYNYSSLVLTEVCYQKLLVELIQKLLMDLEAYQQQGFLGFIELYKKFDKFKNGQSVIVYDNDTPIKGVYRGVNKRGEVEIELGQDIQTYYSGSVSIRPN